MNVIRCFQRVLIFNWNRLVRLFYLFSFRLFSSVCPSQAHERFVVSWFLWFLDVVVDLLDVDWRLLGSILRPAGISSWG